jgi:hypothetical protein
MQPCMLLFNCCFRRMIFSLHSSVFLCVAVVADRSSTSLSIKGSDAHLGSSPSSGVLIQPPISHELPRELQLYYQRITDSVFHGDSTSRDTALSSLSADPGLHQLLPYLVTFVAEQVTRIAKLKGPDLRGSNCVEVLCGLMRVAACLVNNSSHLQVTSISHIISSLPISFLRYSSHSCVDPSSFNWCCRLRCI